MPRIIDVDTEAFAPTYQKAYREPREDPRDVQLRRMGAKLQLAGQAMPFISEGIKGIDQYLVTPIQQAMKESREEEYKAKKAGEMPFEISETTMQKLARERQAAKQGLEDRENLEKGLGIPEFGESMKARVQPLSLQPQEEEQKLSERWLPWRAEPGVAEFPAASLPEEAAQRAAAESRYMPSLVPIRPTVIARHPVTGELRAVAGQPSAGLERGSPAYEMEVSRQRTGLPRKPAAATPAEPAPTRMMPEHPVPTGYQWPARGRYTAAWRAD